MEYTLLIIVLLASVALVGLKLYTRRATRYVQQRAKHVDLFYKSANVLIESRQTPNWVCDILLILSQSLTVPGLSVLILRLMFRRKGLRMEPDRPSISLQNDHPDLFNQFGKACFHALVADTYRYVFVGWIIRRLILVSPKLDGDRAEVFATSLAHRRGLCQA